MSLHSHVKIGFMDDVTLSGDLPTVERDIITITNANAETGLTVNTSKCEIIMKDFAKFDTIDTFKDFIRADKAEMTLLGAPALKDSAQDAAFKHKIDVISRAIERLTLLQVHDTLIILRNSLAIPKLLYLLRTSDCGDNPLLSEFGNTLRSGLIAILNVDLSENQWTQASLPVGDGGLGIGSAQMLAPSAFLASAASTFQLQQSILPDSSSSFEDQSVESIEALWASQSSSDKPAAEVQHMQKAWDGPIAANHRVLLCQEPLVMWTQPDFLQRLLPTLMPGSMHCQ